MWTETTFARSFRTNFLSEMKLDLLPSGCHISKSTISICFFCGESMGRFYRKKERELVSEIYHPKIHELLWEKDQGPIKSFLT